MKVVPFPMARAASPSTLFNTQTRQRAAEMLRAVENDQVGRCALLDAAAMLICASAVEDDEPIAMATVLIDELSERAYDLIALCRRTPDGRA